MAASHVFDATVQTFQAEVMERSLTVPVLLEFWADWCGPCKAFAPTLEKVAAEFGGSFLVAKVDSEAELELSQAFDVRSIPFGVLIAGGRPVDAFARALTEPELRAFLQKHGIDPATALEEPEPEDPEGPEARLRQAREAARAGNVAAVRTALAEFPEESPLLADREGLLSGLAFLEADLEAPVPAAARLQAARAAFLAGQWEDALAAIVESAREDRGYGDGLARKAMVLLQALLGPTELVDEYRRRLATALY